MKQNKTSLSVALGSSLLSLTATSVQADVNGATEASPFEMTELSSGYMQVAEADTTKGTATKKMEGSCGEGKCGAGMDMPKAKVKEGACAGMKKAKEAACGDKMKEGACGDKMKEGACGDKMKEGAMKAGDKMKEGACGDMKKAK